MKERLKCDRCGERLFWRPVILCSNCCPSKQDDKAVNQELLEALEGILQFIPSDNDWGWKTAKARRAIAEAKGTPQS